MLSLLVSIWFQVLFHSPSGVLFTFPSRYYTLSVTRSYLALRDGPRSFTPNSSCSVLLWKLLIVMQMFHVQDYYLLWSDFPIMFYYINIVNFIVGPNPSNITIAGLGSYPFARHYLGNRLFTFFSSWYLDGSVPRVPFITLCIYVMILAG